MGRLTWKRLLWGRRWRIGVVVADADRVPERIAHRRAVLVGDGGSMKWLVFDCPCGRGHRVMLNLDWHRKPAWTLRSQRPLSIRPSIDDHSVARCHFFIRDGRVRWARDAIWESRSDGR
jgi:hypothetical protein